MSEVIQYTVFESDEPTEQFQVQVMAEEGLKRTLTEALEDLIGGELLDIDQNANGMINVRWADLADQEFEYFCIPNTTIYSSWAVQHGNRVAA